MEVKLTDGQTGGMSTGYSEGEKLNEDLILRSAWLSEKYNSINLKEEVWI